MIITNAAINNRITVAVLVVLIAILGVMSYLSLPREAAPDVPIPYVFITTIYEGVSPEDVETAVTMKIEKNLTGISGIKEIRSASSEGVSTILVEFMPDVRIEDALQYVRDKVEQSRGDLPTEEQLREPVVREINVAEFPILTFNISGPVSPVVLKSIADELEDRIEEIPGVLNVDVLGALEREIRLEVDQDRIAAYGLTIPELITLVPSENVNISAGGLRTPNVRFNVRVPAEVVDPTEVYDWPLVERDGKMIYLADIADVRDTFKDREQYSRLDGQESITLSIQKRVGADVIPIADTIKAMLAEAKNVVPRDVTFSITMDHSDDIRMMVADLENNLFAAFVLVMVVLLISMGWRAAVVVATAVPLSMLMSLAIISALGHTLNMIVLFSLVLAVGMLVDNAIVIVENIFRHRELGYDRIEAAKKGAAEVAWPVITSTLTTVAAFIPLLFWSGIMGDFMKYLPITVIVVLSSSLFVALVVSPVVATLLSSKVKSHERETRIRRWYRWWLNSMLEHRATTLMVCILLLVGLGVVFVRVGPGFEFFPTMDPRNSLINIRSPQGTSVERSDELARQVEEQIEKLRGPEDNPHIDYVVTNVGGASGGDPFGGGGTGPHMTNITLTFPDYEYRPRPSADIIAELRGMLTDITGAEVKVERQREGPPTGAAVTVRIVGEDLTTLEKLGEEAMEAIVDVPGLVNLRSDLEATRPELAFIVDRQRASRMGLSTATVGNFLQTAIFGSKVGTFRQFNDEYDITIRLPESQRQDINDLFRLHVPNVTGEAVPLSELGTFEYRGGLGTIHRINQQRVVTLTGDAEGRLAPDVLEDVMSRLDELNLPDNYEIQYAGEREQQDEASRFLLGAFAMACLLIVLILVAQFNTLTAPLIIMTTVVLSLIGVLLGLLITHLPFVIIMTGIGIISLAGVVVNNAIVLLAYTRQLEKQGMDVISATLCAGETRLRPVLLTAITTIIALIPTAIGMGFDIHTFRWVWRSDSSQWWRSMAVAIIFGLTFATFLTLIIVPTLNVSLHKLRTKLGLVKSTTSEHS